MTDAEYRRRIEALAQDLASARLRAAHLYTDLRTDGHGNVITRHVHDCKQSIIIAQGELEALVIILPPPTITND